MIVTKKRNTMVATNNATENSLHVVIYGRV